MKKITCICVLIVALAMMKLNAFAKIYTEQGKGIAGDTADPVPPEKQDEAYPIEMILEECEYSFNESGTVDYSYKRVFRILNQDGLKWNSVSTTWSKWYQHRPEIDASVTSPDGKINLLDQKTLGEIAEEQESPLVYHDRVTIKGPLPAIEIGSIVEEKYIVREKIPFFSGGVSSRYVFNSTLPVKKTRLTINVPGKLSFLYRLYNSPLKPKVTKNGGMVKYDFLMENLPAEKPFPQFSGPDLRHWITIEFTSSPDWKDAARKYHSMAMTQYKKSDAVKKIVDKAKSGGTTGINLIRELVASLNESVRYTGVEFGDASIIPRTPDEVLQRRYGDCKDKSMLLFCMLKEAGFEASLALLKSGTGTDINADIPGINMFNHAIIHVPAPYDLWIDPTVEYMAAGELPYWDRNRRALIISSESPGLVKTPSGKTEQNKAVVSREIFYPSLGPSKATETAEYSGYFADDMRSFFLKNTDKLSENLRKYIKSTYKSEHLGEFTYSRDRIPGHKFTFTLDALRCSRYYSWVDEISVDMTFNFIFDDLPKDIIDFQEYDENGEKENSPWNKRSHDVHLPFPYKYEQRYIIHVPEGMEPVQLPGNQKIMAGVASLEKVFKMEKGTVVVSYTLDTGNGIFSPQEFGEFRRMLHQLSKDSTISLGIAASGQRLYEKGQTGKAVELYKQLIAKQPNDPGNYLRLASTLMSVGLRDAALEHVNLALKSDPASPDGLMMLGWVYLHDPFGRKMTGKFDSEKAIAAYERVAVLDPENSIAVKNLAILYEYDEKGNQYGPGADLGKAISFYKRYRDILKRHELDNYFAFDLFTLGRYDEIIELKDLDLNNGYAASVHLASLAIKHGTPEALKKLGALSPDIGNREEILNKTIDHLTNARRYGLAVELLRHMSSFSRNALKVQTHASFLGKTKKWETFDYSDSSPEGVVFCLLKKTYLEKLQTGDIANIFSRGFGDIHPDNEIEQAYADQRMNIVRYLSKEEKTADSFFDMVMSHMNIRKTGNDKRGYRLLITFNLPDKTVNTTFYVIREGDKYRIAFTENFSIDTIGMLALLHVKNSSPADAGAVLDWAYEHFEKKPGGVMDGHPFVHIWHKGSPDLKEIRLAAYMLLIKNPVYAKQLEVLRGEFKSNDTLLQIDRALLIHYYMTKNPAAAWLIVKKFIDAGIREASIVGTYLELAIRAQHLDEALPIVNETCSKNPGNIDYIYIAATVEIEKGNFEKGSDILIAAHNDNISDARTYNLLAWLGLFTGKDPLELVEFSLKANSINDYSSHACLHTLATLYADMGKVAEAQQAIRKTLEIRNDDSVRIVDNYILGRNAETLGLVDVAENHYRSITPMDEEERMLTVFKLAQKRLSILKKK